MSATVALEVGHARVRVAVAGHPAPAAGLATATRRSADQLVSRLAAELPDAGRLRDDYAILAPSVEA